jgi:hypothetical protein
MKALSQKDHAAINSLDKMDDCTDPDPRDFHQRCVDCVRFHLKIAHAELVDALTIAALARHKSYVEIENAIECLEEAFEMIPVDKCDCCC